LDESRHTPTFYFLGGGSFFSLCQVSFPWAVRGGAPAGIRPERLPTVSGDHRTMENAQAHFKEKRDDLYFRYRLVRTSEERQGAIRVMQKFNLEARKYGKVVPPITATSLREAASQKLEKPFMNFGRMMEAIHKIGFKGYCI